MKLVIGEFGDVDKYKGIYIVNSTVQAHKLIHLHTRLRVRTMAPKISKVDKERLISSFENGEDFIQVAEYLGINQNTARSMIRRHRLNLHPNSHGGHKKHLITECYGEKLRDYVSLNPSATVREMQEFLGVEGLKTSQTTISLFLDRQNISSKQYRVASSEYTGSTF